MAYLIQLTTPFFKTFRTNRILCRIGLFQGGGPLFGLPPFLFIVDGELYVPHNFRVVGDRHITAT